MLEIKQEDLVSKAHKLCNNNSDLFIQIKRILSVEGQERIHMWNTEYINLDYNYKHPLTIQIKSILDQLNIQVEKRSDSLIKKRRFNLP